MSKKSTDFEQMCFDLQNCKCGMCKKKNEIICARRALEQYIDKDHDKYLKIKAEAEELSFHRYSSLLFAIAAFSLSGITGLFDIWVKPFIEKDYYPINTSIFLSCVFSIGLIIAIVKALMFPTKFSAVNKWRRYILAVLNEMEEKMKVKTEVKK